MLPSKITGVRGFVKKVIIGIIVFILFVAALYWDTINAIYFNFGLSKLLLAALVCIYGFIAAFLSLFFTKYNFQDIYPGYNNSCYFLFKNAFNLFCIQPFNKINYCKRINGIRCCIKLKYIFDRILYCFCFRICDVLCCNWIVYVKRCLCKKLKCKISISMQKIIFILSLILMASISLICFVNIICIYFFWRGLLLVSDANTSSDECEKYKSKIK